MEGRDTPWLVSGVWKLVGTARYPQYTKDGLTSGMYKNAVEGEDWERQIGKYKWGHNL
jgi:hypothetical protein